MWCTNDALYILVQVLKDEAGMCTVKATNDQGTMSASARLKVTPVQPPKVVTPLKDTIAPENGPATLKTKITGFPEPEVQWLVFFFSYFTSS